jgi:hypothetical protein
MGLVEGVKMWGKSKERERGGDATDDIVHGDEGE